MDLDLSTSKNSATILPPCGSTSALARVSCQPRDDSGSWLSSVDTRPQNAKSMVCSRTSRLLSGWGCPCLRVCHLVRSFLSGLRLDQNAEQDPGRCVGERWRLGWHYHADGSSV